METHILVYFFSPHHHHHSFECHSSSNGLVFMVLRACCACPLNNLMDGCHCFFTESYVSLYASLCLQVFLVLAFPRRAINSPKRHPPILSPACNLSGLGEKPVASVVWRSGGVLHADPHLPACVGVAPLGMVLGLVFNHSPGFIQARWETLSVKQDSCLWWRVRVADTAPNAPNAPAI
jgi:hypothetical protein